MGTDTDLVADLVDKVQKGRARPSSKNVADGLASARSRRVKPGAEVAALDVAPGDVIKRPGGGGRHIVQAIPGMSTKGGALITDVGLLRKAAIDGDHVAFVGPPGTGKTSSVEAAFGSDLVTMTGSANLREWDIVGTWLSDPDSGPDALRWSWGPLAKAMMEGVPLFVDDFNVIPPNVMARFYSAMDGRNILFVPELGADQFVEAKPGFIVVAACNPRAYGGIFDAPLRSRFTVVLNVSTNFDLCGDDGLRMKTDLIEACKLLDKEVARGAIDWSPQLREMVAFTSIEKKYSPEFALLTTILNKCPRQYRAVIVDAFKKQDRYRNLDYDQIMKNVQAD